MPTTRLAFLFQRYFDKTASPAEVDEFLRLAGREEHAEELQALMAEAWQRQQPAAPVFTPGQSATLLHNVLETARAAEVAEATEKTPPRIRLLWRLAAAAVTVGVIGSAAWWWAQQKQPAPKIAQAAPKTTDVAPGYNRAVLILSDGSAVSLDSVQKGKLAQQGNTAVMQVAGGRVAYDAQNAHDEPVAYNTIKTPRGGQYQVTLPDGSKVWLNAASSLRFPTAFTGSDRTVELTGEAYFEIAARQNQPFKVKVNETQVDVLGTHFDVMAYPEEGRTQTSLLEGAVRIDNLTLQPGEAAVQQDGQMTRTDIDPDQVIAWKNGLFHFESNTLEEVMHQVSRWYDVDVRYDTKVKRHFSGLISRSASLTEVLKMLDMAGKAKFDLDGKTVTVKAI